VAGGAVGKAGSAAQAQLSRAERNTTTTTTTTTTTRPSAYARVLAAAPIALPVTRVMGWVREQAPRADHRPAEARAADRRPSIFAGRG
jgi:hypothetical protein